MKSFKEKKHQKSGMTKEQVHQELERLYRSNKENMSRGAQNLTTTITSAHKDEWRRPLNRKGHKAK